MPSPKQQLGYTGEVMARRFLEEKGYLFLEANYHSRFGEIDLVMLDGETLVFVEVKMRRGQKFGLAVESVNWKKRRRFRKTINHFFQNREIVVAGWRIDLVAIQENGPGSQIEISQVMTAF